MHDRLGIDLYTQVTTLIVSLQKGNLGTVLAWRNIGQFSFDSPCIEIIVLLTFNGHLNELNLCKFLDG